MTPELSYSGTSGGEAEPVAVGVYEAALSASEAVLVDGNVELLGYGVDVPDIQADKCVGARVS